MTLNMYNITRIPLLMTKVLGEALPPSISDVLSWTLNSKKGFDGDDESIDRTSNANNAKLVQSYCAEFSTSDVITFTDLTGVTLTSYESDGVAVLAKVGNTLTATTGGKIWNILLSDGTHIPCQNTLLDVSGNNNHPVNTSSVDTTALQPLGATNDYHYNILRGHSLWQKSGNPDILVPYGLDGNPLSVTPGTTPGIDSGYTKTSDNPADYWNNGAETGFIVGATTFDGTGWNVDATVKTTDTAEILHDAGTGYGKILTFDEFDYVFDSGSDPTYLYCNISTTNQYFNLLLYETPQTLAKSVNLAKFIGAGDYLVVDAGGEQIFDANNQAIIST